jgi:3-oxoacyl-[acyl-carrier protein] reductase
VGLVPADLERDARLGGAGMTIDAASSIAIVSGATGAIGSATCRALVAEGHHVIVGFRSDAAAADRLAAELAPHATAVALDVTDEHQVDTCLARAQELGTVAILVNNAGMTGDDLLLRLDPARFDLTIDTNLRGAYLLTRAALRPMLRARFGRIVNVSSIVALRGNAGQVAYAAAKAGMIGMTRSLAREVARKGITVNAVAPGFVESAMTAELPADARQALVASAPVGRAVLAEEVASAIAYLASPDAAAITGAVLPVDGGAAI